MTLLVLLGTECERLSIGIFPLEKIDNSVCGLHPLKSVIIKVETASKSDTRTSDIPLIVLTINSVWNSYPFRKRPQPFQMDLLMFADMKKLERGSILAVRT